MIDFNRARFLTSASTLAQLPPDTGAEVAFAGRSNAGKSSALNALTAQTGLARAAKTPGRTQLLNFFSLGVQLRLVDLPGYGYAKVPLAIKRAWQQTLSEYLHARQSLRGVVLVMDIRHPLTDLDQAFCDWCAQAALPLHVLLNKADKLSHGAAQTTLHAVTVALAPHASATVQIFSALRGTGLTAGRAVVAKWLEAKPRA